MTWTIALLVASALAFGLKLLGDLVTVGLLAAMVASQAFTTGTAIRFDARVAALAVAAILFWRKVPFVVVVIAAAAVAAGLRALGWG